MGRPFQSAADFAGDYSGNYDGRPCELSISQVFLQAGGRTLDFWFHDLEEDTYFKQEQITPTSVNSDPAGGVDYSVHCLSLWLYETDASGTSLNNTNSLHWTVLSLHTWDIDYISGVSIWNGGYYGMSFTRK
jgi:hypothetical protein